MHFRWSAWPSNVASCAVRRAERIIAECPQDYEDLVRLYAADADRISFCYVEDTVEGLLRLMESGCNAPVNIGNPVEHTVLELAQTVLRLTGSLSAMVFRPLPADDPRRRRPDITRAQRELGWSPQVPLEAGLQCTIDWFRSLLVQGTAPSSAARPLRQDTAPAWTGPAFNSPN